jgi:ketosteroid isomerase-like protein
MPPTNEELIRAAYKAYAGGDIDTLLRAFSPDLEWTYLNPMEADPQPQVCRGMTELSRALRRQAEQGLRADIEEIHTNGDQVMMVLHIPGVDALRLRQANDRNFDVFTIHDGVITALRAFRTRGQALAAAGIP